MTKDLRLMNQKQKRVVVFCLNVMVLAVVNTSTARVEDRLVTYPAPVGVALNHDFSVQANGEALDVYRFAVRRTQECYIGVAAFDFSGQVTVEVQTQVNIQSAVIRPLRHRIRPQTRGKTLRFTLDQPVNLSLEINNDLDRWNLMVFANPIEIDRPSPDDPDVIYFGPGLHQTGNGMGDPANRLTINKPGTTIYLAGGSVVQGSLFAEDIEDVTIRGRGILSGECMEHERSKQRYRCLEFRQVTGLNVEGFILQDAPHHGLMMVNCHKVDVNNFHNVSQNSNSDGINPISCTDVTIRKSFVRTVDDGIAIKNGKFGANGPTENILVEDSVLWNDDWGNGLEIGFETTTGAFMRNITFRRVDVLHSRNSNGEAITIHNGDAADIHDVLFEDVVVEDLRGSNGCLEFFIRKTKYSKDAERGKIHNITLRRVSWPAQGKMLMEGYDAEHRIESIHFEDCQEGGLYVEGPQDLTLSTNAFVSGIYYHVTK
ncbi:glycosyl hydrolase family 28 protein [Planctomycetota bacterium]